ncbi:MAG: TetR/AcrR family transcriptional regulator [Acidimicrobiales bacterium]
MNQRLPGPERRQQLLDVALEMFGVGGYSEASVAEIATAAGITKPVVYQHFDSKRALFLEVLRECGRRMEAEIDRATSQAAGPREQVQSGFRAFFRFFDENPASFRVLFSDANRSDPEFAAEAHRVEVAVAERIATLIEIESLNPDERRLLAVGIVGMAESTCRQWMSASTDVSAERAAELMSELAWAGLRGQ